MRKSLNAQLAKRQMRAKQRRALLGRQTKTPVVTPVHKPESVIAAPGDVLGSNGQWVQITALAAGAALMVLRSLNDDS